MGTPDMYGPQPTGATNTPITTVAEDIATEITDTIADIIPAVENTFKAPIRENIQEFARGGIASGLAMVGEQGPELVDFNTPGRIYSANDTATMLGNTSVLINEIKALRQEVAKLREEQREQTGHIITTNYDANNRAAEKIAETQEQSVNSMNWKEKLAPKII